MLSTKHIATVAVATTIGIGGISAPALAKTSTHWSNAQCRSWQKGFMKRNPHPSTARKAQGNKVLKGQRCTQRIK